MPQCAIPKYTRNYRIFQNIPQSYPQVFCIYKGLTLLKSSHFFPISQPVFFFLARHWHGSVGSLPVIQLRGHVLHLLKTRQTQRGGLQFGTQQLRDLGRAGWWVKLERSFPPKKMPGKPLGFLHLLFCGGVFQGKLGGG